jgi:ParB/RepB/Spo0J family partition protein
MKIVNIPLNKIGPDPDNPNQMDDATLDALLAEIEDRGFVQPLLVRKVEISSANPAIQYRIVDGEHRWRVLGQLGADTIPCVIDSDEVNPKLRMLTMNQLRGTFVPIKMAHLLADLRTRIPEKEIQERLAMSRKELKDYLSAGGYELDVPEPTAEKDTDDERPMEREKWVNVTVLATPAEAAAISDLLEPYSEGDGDQSKQHGRVIAALARQFVS